MHTHQTVTRAKEKSLLYMEQQMQRIDKIGMILTVWKIILSYITRMTFNNLQTKIITITNLKIFLISE